MEPTDKVRLYRVRLNSGGYDADGSYWGVGPLLYRADDGGEFRTYLRAADREDAKAKLRKSFPGILFYR